MGLKKEFKQGRNWVRYRFDLKKANQMISSFETVIRFLGGLLSAYHMSGDKVFLDKAKDVAVALEFAFRVFLLANHKRMDAIDWLEMSLGQIFLYCSQRATGDNDSKRGRILSEIGSFHLEYYDLAFATGDKIWLERAMAIRRVIQSLDTVDGLYPNRMTSPRRQQQEGKNDSWQVYPETREISFGAQGDSFYEYLLKSFYQTGGKDLAAKQMYDQSIIGAKKHLIRSSLDGRYLSDYPNQRPTMQHLACFAGGLIAYGAKNSTTPGENLELGADLTKTCYLSYHNTKTKIGSERFDTSPRVRTGYSQRHYILRPEVIESYFYLWRVTKNPKYRQWAWEAAKALETHCKTEFGYSGLLDVNSNKPGMDDLQRSFFLAETLKYLYLIFSDEDLISLEEFVFNTEAHPLLIIK